jgi:hypothetical protein
MTEDAKAALGRYAPPDDGEHVGVQLLNFPLQVFAKAREHHEELLREFALLALSPPADRPGHHVPQQFLDLINTLGVRYAGIGTSTDAIRDAAIARGEQSMDLTYELPRSVGPAMQELRDLIDLADQFCRDGQMLTMALAPQERDFLWWFVAEISNQAGGAAPSPWPGSTKLEF